MPSTAADGSTAEVGRRLVHVLGAVVPAGYVFGLVSWPHLQAIMVAGLAVALVLEGLRLTGGIDWVIFTALTRGYEQDNLAGYALYVIGMAAVVLVFAPADAPVGVLHAPGAALAGMFMLALGDPISGLLGSDTLRRVKQAYVLLVMFGVCTLIARAFVPPIPAVVGGLAAATADGAKPVVAGYVVDDNLTIPSAGAVAIWLTLTFV